jgi:hypothetical protein
MDGWYFLPPKEGLLAYDREEDELIVYNGTLWVTVGGSGTPAPLTATYFTLTTNVFLTVERLLDGVADEISFVDNGPDSTVEFHLADDMIVPGVERILVPKGTTAQRPSSPTNGDFRYNSDNERFEGYEDGMWSNMTTQPPAGLVPAVTGQLVADEVWTADTTLRSINAILEVPVDADGDYTVIWQLRINTTQPYKFDFTGPASEDHFWFSLVTFNSGITNQDTLEWMDDEYTPSPAVSIDPSSGRHQLTIVAALTNGVNAGTLVLRFAQDNAATSLTIWEGSSMRSWKMN